MYWFTLSIGIAASILTGMVGILWIEVTDLRANLKETLEENEMLWQLAENLNRTKIKIAALGRHPATGEIGEKIMKILSETNLTSSSQDR
jgi:regulator of replication initiation timing